MSKKYLEDEDDYQWNDDLDWDERADEFDDSFDDVDDRPRKKKSSSGKKTVSKGTAKGTAKNSTKKHTDSSAKNSGKATGKTTGKTESTKTKTGVSKSTGKNGTKKAGKKAASAKKKRRRGMMIVLAILEILALGVVCVGLYVMSLFNKMTPPPVVGGHENNPSFRPGKDAEVNDLDQGVLETMQGYYTFAILGLDQRDQSDYSQGQSDVIVLVTVNKDTGEINMSSIYRDTYLMVDQSGRYGKINAAYNYGGPHQAIQALNTNLDLQIDYYATVNWKAVAEIIDLVGGVEIEIPEKIFYAKDQHGGSLLNSYIYMTGKEMDYPITYPTGPGYQTLNGLQAVGYCRIRQVNLLDYGRAENQRQVLSKVFEKVQNVVKRMDFATLLQIINTATEYIITDVTPQQAFEMLKGIGDYYLDDSTGFPFSDKRAYANPTDTNSGIFWNDCIIPKDLISNLTELHRVLYNNDKYVPSETVLNISAKISADSGVYAN